MFDGVIWGVIFPKESDFPILFPRELISEPPDDDAALTSFKTRGLRKTSEWKTACRGMDSLSFVWIGFLFLSVFGSSCFFGASNLLSFSTARRKTSENATMVKKRERRES